MLTLERYLSYGVDPESIIASAIIADEDHHAMMGAAQVLAELHPKMHAANTIVEATVIERAALSLAFKVQAHRKVVDELIERGERFCSGLRHQLKKRRVAMTETREVAVPLMKMSAAFMRMEVMDAAMDAANEMMNEDDLSALAVANRILKFGKMFAQAGKVTRKSEPDNGG